MCKAFLWIPLIEKVHIKNCESDLTWGWGWSSETLRQVSLASSSPGFEFGALGPEQWPESRGKFRSIGSGVSLPQGESLVSQLHLSHDLLLLLLKAEQEKRGTDRGKLFVIDEKNLSNLGIGIRHGSNYVNRTDTYCACFYFFRLNESAREILICTHKFS